MGVYKSPDHVYTVFEAFFSCMQEEDPNTAQEVAKSGLIIRLRLAAPAAEIIVNGRKNPLELFYGTQPLRPDLDVEMPADYLHQILLGELSLKKALASGKLKIHGPIFKAIVLEQIFRRGQSLYPKVWEKFSDLA